MGDRVLSPDALLMQTKAESRARCCALGVLYVAAALLIGAGFLGELELRPARWATSVNLSAGHRSLEVMVAATSISSRVSVRLQTQAAGAGYATLLLETDVRLEVFRGVVPRVDGDDSCSVPELLVLHPNGIAVPMQTVSSGHTKMNGSSAAAATHSGGASNAALSKVSACAFPRLDSLGEESWASVLDSSRVHIVRCPSTTLGATSFCQPYVLFQLDTSPGYMYRIRLTLPPRATFNTPESVATPANLSASTVQGHTVRRLATSGVNANSSWIGPTEATLGGLSAASLELSALDSSQRWRSLFWRLILMLITLAVRHWYHEQISDFLLADLLPQQSFVTFVALSVALHQEPFSHTLTLLRGGHSFTDALQITHFALAYPPLLSFAHVSISAARLRRRPAIVGFWLPKLLLLICIFLPLAVAWPLRSPAPIITRLDGMKPSPENSPLSLLGFWLGPVYYDVLRQPVDLSGLGDRSAFLLLAEGVALIVYSMSFLVALISALFAEEAQGRRGWWHPLALALLTVGCALSVALAHLYEAVYLETHPTLPLHLRLWMTSALSWLVLVAVSPAHSMRQLIGTSRLRERAELWLRQSEWPAVVHGEEAATPFENDLRGLAPGQKVRRIAGFFAQFSMLHKAEKGAIPSQLPRQRAQPSRTLRSKGVEMQLLGYRAAGEADEWISPSSTFDDQQQRVASWLQGHMSCNMHFLPAWRLGTVYLVMYGLVGLVVVLTLTGSAALPRSAVVVETYVNATSCVNPLLPFDPSRCDGVDALGGDEVRVNIRDAEPNERELRLALRLYNSAYRIEGLIVPLEISVALYAQLDHPMNNASGQNYNDLQDADDIPDSNGKDDPWLAFEDGSGDRAIEGGTRLDDEGEPPTWTIIRSERVLQRELVCLPRRRACELISLTWDDGIAYRHYQYRVRFSPSLGSHNFGVRHGKTNVSRWNAPLPDATFAATVPLPLGEVALIVSRTAAAWSSLQVQLGLVSSAISFMMLAASVWQVAGAGWPTPQQRVMPVALFAAIIYSNDGLPPLLFLLAPAHLTIGWAITRMVAKAATLCVFAFVALVEVHAHGYDDLHPRARYSQSIPKRTFLFFWAPKLVFLVLCVAVSTSMAASFVIATQGQDARVALGLVAYMMTPDMQPLSLALVLLGGSLLAYYVGIVSWVALRAIPSRKLRADHRARFFWQTQGSALFVCAVFGSESLPLALEYLQVPTWTSEESSAAETITTLVAQLFVVNIYFALQAWLYLPSAGMRALRRAQRKGVDLQREALAALLPSVAGSHTCGLDPGLIHCSAPSGSESARGKPREQQLQSKKRPDVSSSEQPTIQALLRDRLAALGELAIQQEGLDTRKGFFALNRPTEGEELLSRYLKAASSHRVVDLGVLLKELSFNPMRAREFFCDDVRARFEDLEIAAPVGMLSSHDSSASLARPHGNASLDVEAREGELAAWAVAPLLGIEMVLEACRQRLRKSLEALHMRLQRLRDILNSRTSKRNLSAALQDDRILSTPEAALLGFISLLLTPEHLPLPFGLLPQESAGQRHGVSPTGSEGARSRFHLYHNHATWLPWSKTVRSSDALGWQLLDAITSWLDALHELDSAMLGYVKYEDLEPAELAEVAQAEWRRVILEFNGAPEALLRIRPFLLSRPELTGMAEIIDNASSTRSLLAFSVRRSGVQYNYAILLKDMSGYTIEACPPRKPWRSSTVSFDSRVATTGRSVHRMAVGQSQTSPAQSDEVSEDGNQYTHFLDLHRGEFTVDFGGSTPWGIAPSEGQLRTKIIETDMQVLTLKNAPQTIFSHFIPKVLRVLQLWLQLWLRGALQRNNDDFEELRRIKMAFGALHVPDSSTASVTSPRLAALRLSLGKTAPSHTTIQRACRSLELSAKFVISFRVLRLTTWGGEELVGTARWIPPWRLPGRLLEAQQEAESLEATASRLRDEWLLQGSADATLSEQAEELPLLNRSEERVGTLNVVVHAVDAFREVYAKMEHGIDNKSRANQKAGSDTDGIAPESTESVGGMGRYLLQAHTAPWEDLYQALAVGLARQRTGLFSLSTQLPDWLLQLHQLIRLGRERPQHALVLELSAEEHARLSASIKSNPSLEDVTLVPCLKLSAHLVSLETNQHFSKTLRGRLCAGQTPLTARVVIEASLDEQLSAAERRKVFSPFSANQLLEMEELRSCDYVETIIQRLHAAGFDSHAIRVNSEELPMVRTSKEDAKYGKQVLLLLDLHPDKITEEFESIKRARFEREGSAQVMIQSKPTSAEELQIIDRLLRRPLRLGGAELHHPPRPELSRLGRDAGFPPPSWKVGGVELIEACYPLHDQAFNRELQRSIKSTWFLSEAQLSVIRGHYGEEIGFMFAYYDLKNRLCVPVAIVGIVVSILKLLPSVAGSKAVAVLNTGFGLIMVLWGAAVLVLWQRQKAHLQHVWGVEHFQGRTYERPEFECWHDPATGNPRYYPTWMRNAKRSLSLLVTFLQVCFLVTLTLLIYIQYVTSTEFFTGLTRKFLASGVNSLLYGFVIMVLELGLFRHISGLLSEFENWQLQSEYESAYVFKVFFFIFIDGYLWYWVLGFFHIPIIRDNSLPDGTMSPDFAQQFTIFGMQLFSSSTTVEEWVYSFEYSITMHVIGVNFFMLALENLFPVLLRQYSHFRWKQEVKKLAKRRPDLSNIAGRWEQQGRKYVLNDQVLQLRQVLREGNQETYNTFWDMYDLVLYTGYQSVMSLLQPLTPFCFLVNDILEVVTDPIKIAAYQRALPQTKRSLGEWERCLWFQLYAAVLQVALFISFSTQTLEQLWYTDSYDPAYFVNGRLTVASRLSVAFVLCGFMYLCIMVIQGTFSALPEDTVEKHEREKVVAARRVRAKSYGDLHLQHLQQSCSSSTQDES